ncbi:MAG: Fructose-1,6-bisphosphatase/inositol-1-monophosphatase [Methanonatronarchaeales archaeon]|nr:Fructose-1,6-bisphosphatase/inositol-1-monophosphatase [Methanonatronarchaeales archaeon]
MTTVLDALERAADAAEAAMVETENWDEVVGEGADGRPTLRVDDAAERAALDVLGELDARVVSEESGAIGEGEGLLVLDPLDGTGNAVRGVPFYSFSAAHLGGEDSALVKDLVNGDVFTYGDGVSRMNGEEVSVSGASDISASSISLYTYGTERGTDISIRARRTRTLGSAALELCYVAAGILDGMASLRSGLSPTDYAAGRMIVEGAGGAVETMGEESVEQVERTVSLHAGPPALVAELGRWSR